MKKEQKKKQLFQLRHRTVELFVETTVEVLEYKQLQVLK